MQAWFNKIVCIDLSETKVNSIFLKFCPYNYVHFLMQFHMYVIIDNEFERYSTNEYKGNPLKNGTCISRCDLV